MIIHLNFKHWTALQIKWSKDVHGASVSALRLFAFVLMNLNVAAHQSEIKCALEIHLNSSCQKLLGKSIV